MINLTGKKILGMEIVSQNGEFKENSSKEVVDKTNKELIELKTLSKNMSKFPQFEEFLKEEFRSVLQSKREIIKGKDKGSSRVRIDFKYPLSRASLGLLCRAPANDENGKQIGWKFSKKVNSLDCFLEKDSSASFSSVLKEMKEIRGKEVQLVRTSNREIREPNKKDTDIVAVFTPDSKVIYGKNSKEGFSVSTRLYEKMEVVEPKELKRLGRRIRASDGSTLKISGHRGSYNEPGYVLKLQKIKKLPTVNSVKVPTTKENHVGVEIEFYSKFASETLAMELTKFGIGEWGNLKTDGSLTNDKINNKASDSVRHYGQELTLCAPESKITEVVEKACAMINKIGGKLNKTCGLHVHIDMRNRNREVVFNNLVRSQDLMYNMQPKERRGSKYCMKQENNELVVARRNTGGERRFGVNPEALDRHNTIELRMHSGTTNPLKINNWIKLLIAIADKKEVVETNVKTKDLRDTFGVSSELLNYIESRIEKFRKKEETENEISGVEVA